MSTKEGKKTRKPVTGGIRNKREKKIVRTRSSEYQTLKSGGKRYAKEKVGSFKNVNSVTS